MLSQLLTKVIHGHDLSENEMQDALSVIMSDEGSAIQTGAFLAALATKGESISEISGCAKVMRDKAVRIQPAVKKIIDTCGTGGDRSGSFNISTTVAIVVSACNIAVAKHGNRAVSSQTGSAEVLEELGLNINLLPEQVEKCIEEVGIGFLFAPLFHPAMMHVAAIRKELGFRSIFNIVGPLSNPALSPYQLLGVFDPNLTEIMAEVLNRLGTKRAMVVHGSDGMDEITLTGRTKVTELRDGKLNTFFIQPDEFGLKTCASNALQGGDSRMNADIVNNILAGKETGAKRGIVLLNAAAALVVADAADDIKAGLEIAEKVIDSGKAKKKLENLIAFSNKADWNK